MSETSLTGLGAASIPANPASPKRKSVLTIGRVGLYVFLITAALFFLLPLFVMLITSVKPMEEIRNGNLLALPQVFTLQPWVKAWTQACTGLKCEGIQVGFWNSWFILIPSVIVSIAAGALNGYALSFWKIRGAEILFAILMLGAFVPYQVYIFPLVQITSKLGLFNTLPGIVVVHTIFGLPVMTLLFRNFYVSVPRDLFSAARVDGCGFLRIFWSVMLPMSTPIIVVAAILQTTGIWNDFILGLVFAGRDNWPMTVQLNNVINSTQGEREYNVQMAATILTALVPMLVYFLSGRYFVRGIAAGAVKG